MIRSAFSEGVGPGFTYLGYRAAAFVAERLPLKAGDALARAGGAIAFRAAKGKRQIVRSNLARVVGQGEQLDELTRAAFYSYARYWLETFRAGRYRREELLSMVESDTTSVIEGAYSQGRGVVVVTAHFGFYDLGVAWFGAKGWPMTTVAEVLKPRALFEWFAANRAVRGMPVIPARPSSEARQRLTEIVGSGGAVALLADRDLGRRGIWVEFFGEATTIPVFPAILTLRTGAPLLSAGIYSKAGGDGFRIDFEKIEFEPTGNEDDDVPRVAQLIAEAAENIVRKSPEQWHLFSSNWPSDEPNLPPRGSARDTPAQENEQEGTKGGHTA